MLKAALLTFALLGSSAAQVEKRTCDHPAPPEGMRYVCSPKDSCDCRLERISSEREWRSVNHATAAIEPCSTGDLKYFVAPAYPAAARSAKKQATVIAQLVVDISGTGKVTVESGDPMFTESVESALRKWRFTPRASPKTLTVTLTFALAGDPTDHINTTVSGSSPLNLVIAATPPLH